MATIAGMRDVSSTSTSSRKSSSETSSGSSAPVVNSRKMIEKLLGKIDQVPILSLQSRGYQLSQQEMAVLGTLFGQANCVSPWQSKGAEGIVFLFIVVIIILIIFFCGPGFFCRGSYFMWGLIFVILLFLVIGSQYWSTYRSQEAIYCQV